MGEALKFLKIITRQWSPVNVKSMSKDTWKRDIEMEPVKILDVSLNLCIKLKLGRMSECYLVKGGHLSSDFIRFSLIDPAITRNKRT